MTSVPTDENGWIHEMKFDGYRMQGQLKDGIGHFFTRTGLDWSRSFPHLLNAIEKLKTKNAIFDGEIVALDEEGKSHFQRLQNSLKLKSDQGLQYYIFDLLYLNGEDLRSLPLLERKEKLRELLKDSSDLLKLSEHIEGRGDDFFQVSCEHKLEGIISKLSSSPYVSGRNDLWVKTKCQNRQEFVIGGWTNPEGGRVGIGALLLGVYEGEEFRYVGKVGTGFNTQSLKDIKKDLLPIQMKKSPFTQKSPKGKNINWVKPIKACEVTFSSWTQEGILRIAVFQGMRMDKKPEEIVKEVSSPDKVLFKKEKKTKQDVVMFYKKVSKHMLPYIADRPLSLVRCPNGTAGKCFFQKHFVGNIPDSFHTFPVKEGTGEGMYLSINSVEGLVELVQLNAFEIHAWNSHRDNYMRPDQIVMDFDPGAGVTWKRVVDAALELRELLEDLGLKSFVKLTGGKGLHVHIPIAPFYSWDQVKSFSQAIALEMVSRKPKMYVANMSKNLRRNKIFIDYLRNGQGATAVVPYSLRARETTAIALPVEWNELKRIKSGAQFTMEKALRKIKLRKRDPWEEMLRLHQEIEVLVSLNKAA